MRILSITAGAAGMYCGSCFRDNALAAALIAAGHDVTLVPVYTPTRTDEPNLSQHRVLFGGISIYLQQHSAVFRKAPRLVDRLLDHPTVIRALTVRAASTDARLLGGMAVSMVRGTSGMLRKEFEKLVEWAGDEPAPDIINLPNSLLIAMARPLSETMKRPVCCTLQGEELFLNGLVEPYRSEVLRLIRDEVRYVDRFIAVSEAGAATMTALLHIPAERMSVVPLGIDMRGYAIRRAEHPEFRVGYFARIAPEKGLHMLAEAYVRLRRQAPERPMRLEAAGYMASTARPYLAGVRRTLDAAGLEGEFTYHGELDRDGKLAFLASLDVLSVPATYDEPKGMFLLEAMASGVPVVQPQRGAFTEIVQRTGGGILVPPDNAAALADALLALSRDPAGARALGDRAFQGVRERHTVEQSAATIAGVYRDVIAGAPSRVA